MQAGGQMMQSMMIHSMNLVFDQRRNFINSKLNNLIIQISIKLNHNASITR